MYTFSSIKAEKQGDELFQVTFADGGQKEFQIWDYSFLYSYPDLYRQLIVEHLECGVYDAIENMLLAHIPKDIPLRIADIACGSGLMGKRLADTKHFSIDYLAGVEITAEALTALERDTPGVYDNSYLIPDDDLSTIKGQNINCLMICGAASHLTLEDYHFYLPLLSETEPVYIVFNLVSNPRQQNRKDILQWMDEKYTLLDRQMYTHRKLLNDGSSQIQHEMFIYQQER